MGTKQYGKEQALTLLREEFDRWEEFLGRLTEDQITAPQLPSGLSIKDIVAHLWAWQQLSIARMEAALNNREPRFSLWPAWFDPESEHDTDSINAWIYETYRDKPWSNVYEDWRSGFLHLLELGAQIPAAAMTAPGYYPWLNGYPLILVLLGSYEHHHDDHLEPLLGQFR